MSLNQCWLAAMGDSCFLTARAEVTGSPFVVCYLDQILYRLHKAVATTVSAPLAHCSNILSSQCSWIAGNSSPKSIIHLKGFNLKRLSLSVGGLSEKTITQTGCLCSCCTCKNITSNKDAVLCRRHSHCKPQVKSSTNPILCVVYGKISKD